MGAAGLGLVGLACPAPGDDANPSAEVPPARTATAATWSTFASKPCGFSVELPSSPSPQATPPGLLDQIAHDGPRMAMVASCGEVPSVGSPQEFLGITAQVIAQKLNARIDERAPFEQQGRPGLELRMTIPHHDQPPGMAWPSDVAYRLRLLVAGQRQYQVHLLYPATAPAEVVDTGERFLAGFQLLSDAPAAAAPLPWSTHAVAGVTVEAPGDALPLEPGPGAIAAIRFGRDDRSTPYALSVWPAPTEPAEPIARLRANFLLHVATEHAEIVAETPALDPPRLDVRYRPNTPLPPHLVPRDAEARSAIEGILERSPSEFRVRLVLLGDRIVQLRVANTTPEDEPERFLDSLRSDSAG